MVMEAFSRMINALINRGLITVFPWELGSQIELVSLTFSLLMTLWFFVGQIRIKSEILVPYLFVSKLFLG
jgi:hypothetical protein